jgi:hypothetical protein
MNPIEPDAIFVRACAVSAPDRFPWKPQAPGTLFSASCNPTCPILQEKPQHPKPKTPPPLEPAAELDSADSSILCNRELAIELRIDLATSLIRFYLCLALCAAHATSPSFAGSSRPPRRSIRRPQAVLAVRFALGEIQLFLFFSMEPIVYC